MGQHDVKALRAVGITERVRVTCTRRCERFKSQALEIARRSDIPRIGDDEATGLVQLAEGLALIGNGRTCGHVAPQFSPIGKNKSMIVARHEFLRHTLIFDRRLQHHAVRQLVHYSALDFLPRRLAHGIMEAAVLL